jgi:hypothetical protein
MSLIIANPKNVTKMQSHLFVWTIPCVLNHDNLVSRIRSPKCSVIRHSTFSTRYVEAKVLVEHCSFLMYSSPLIS